MTANSTANNIILFPGVYHLNPLNEAVNNIRLRREEEIDEATDEIAQSIMEELAVVGITFDTSTKELYVSSLAMLIESIRALLSKYYRHHHPLHDVSDRLFRHLGNGKVEYNYDTDDNNDTDGPEQHSVLNDRDGSEGALRDEQAVGVRGDNPPYDPEHSAGKLDVVQGSTRPVGDSSGQPKQLAQAVVSVLQGEPKGRS